MSLHLTLEYTLPGIVMLVGALGFFFLKGKWSELCKMSFVAGLAALLLMGKQ